MQVGTKMQKEFYQVYKPKVELPIRSNQFRKTYKKIGFTFGVCLTALSIYGAQAANIRFSKNETAGERTYTFSWDNGANFDHSLNDKEIRIDFTPSEQISMVDNDRMLSETSAHSDNVQYGYDYFIFTPAEHSRMHVKEGPGRVQITLSKKEAHPDNVSNKNDTTTIKLIQARGLLEKGEFEEAYKIVDQLNEQQPQNPQILKSLAGIENSTGRWESAIQHLLEAEKIAPLDEDIKSMKNGLADSYGSSVDGNFEFKRVGTTKHERIGRLNGRVKILPGTFIGAKTEVNRLKVENITRARTGVLGTVKTTIHRDEIYAEHNFLNGNQVRGAYFASNGHSGGGATIKLNDFNGHFLFSGEYNKADWGNNESLVDKGVRHQLKAGRYQQFTPHFFASINGAANWYDINGTTQAAKSLGWNGLISYTMPFNNVSRFFGHEPSITFTYNVDAEYPTNTKRTTGTNGTQFKPLPLTYQEVHGFEVAGETNLTSWLHVYGFAGYTFDRYGGNGPRGGAKITIIPMDRVSLTAEVTSSVSDSDTKQREDRAIIGAKYVF